MPLPLVETHVIKSLDNQVPSDATTYADVSNTLQTRMAYEQQQSYLHTSSTQSQPNNGQSSLHMLGQPSNSHHVLFDDTQNIAIQSQTMAPMDGMLDGMKQQDHFGVPSYQPSAFNLNFNLPLSTALPPMPNSLFLPSFAALTTDTSQVLPNPSNLPPVPSTSSESALTSVLQSSSKGSGESQHSSGWTPLSQSHDGGSHASLTIVRTSVSAR